MESLETLTNELFEQIVQHLNLHDIQHLRLASRTTAHKATQETFRSHFRISCLVDDLSLVGVVYDLSTLKGAIDTGERRAREEEMSLRPDRQFVACGKEELRQAAEDLQILQRRQRDDEEFRIHNADTTLLREAFSNLAVYRPGRLKRLSLQIAVYRDDSTTRLMPLQCDCWERVFQAATRVFSLTMTCLKDTQLAVQALDVFTEKPRSLACSLPCDAIDFKAKLPFSRLGMMSISISDQLLNEDEPETVSRDDDRRQKRDQMSAQIADEEIYTGLAKMLQQCPVLEQLEVSGYLLTRKDPELNVLQSTMRRRHIYHLAHMSPLTHLRHLRLAGLPSQQKDLLAFLRNHQSSLREVELNSISMGGDDSFTPIFSFPDGRDHGPRDPPPRRSLGEGETGAVQGGARRAWLYED